MISTDGLNVVVFTMNYVLLFVMWALVAAIPCQDRGLQTHFTIARQYFWAIPIHSPRENIGGIKETGIEKCLWIVEIHEIEKCT